MSYFEADSQPTEKCKELLCDFMTQSVPFLISKDGNESRCVTAVDQRVVVHEFKIFTSETFMTFLIGKVFPLLRNSVQHQCDRDKTMGENILNELNTSLLVSKKTAEITSDLRFLVTELMSHVYSQLNAPDVREIIVNTVLPCLGLTDADLLPAVGSEFNNMETAVKAATDTFMEILDEKLDATVEEYTDKLKEDLANKIADRIENKST